MRCMLRRACNKRSYGVFVRVRDGDYLHSIHEEEEEDTWGWKSARPLRFLVWRTVLFLCFIACDTRQGMRRFLGVCFGLFFVMSFAGWRDHDLRADLVYD
jgi:hypothetical protein